MRRCPGPGCDTKISDDLGFCAACVEKGYALSVHDADGVPQRVDLYAEEGIAQLERSLCRHAEFSRYLDVRGLA